MRQTLAVLVGKAVLALGKLRGGGSAFPGLVALRLSPRLLENAFARIPRGVIFVLGSNGKSTTTHMVSDILRSHGLRVFTNPTGANLPQGVASSLLGQVGLRGVIDADIAVLEVDEAFAVELARTLRPRIVLGLNTQIDQLYRFIDTERAGHMMLDAMARAAAEVISNRDDPFLRTIDTVLTSDSPRLTYFGVTQKIVDESPNGLLNADNFTEVSSGPTRQAQVQVEGLVDGRAVIRVDKTTVSVKLPAFGLHYAVDAAAAVTVAWRELGDDWSPAATEASFDSMKPAYGRGEVLPFEGTQVTMVMFKNLASLQLNVDSLRGQAGPLMVAIDEGTPDMSWIYDAKFDGIDRVDVVSGDKAWQMALCLKMRGVRVDLVEPNVRQAVEYMRELASDGRRQTWLVNYEVTMIARTLIGFGELETQS